MPIWSTEPRVMAETTSRSPTAITTSAMTLPSLTDFTVPLNWLRALSISETVPSNRVGVKNRSVHRLGRAHGIEVFAQVRDLAAGRAQEHHILLAIDAPRRFDQPL